MSRSYLSKELLSGAVANGQTRYVEVGIHDDTIGLHIAWLDATSSATITLELSSNSNASATSTAASDWVSSGVSITGPAGSAIGASLVNVENVRQLRARLKIVAAANCDFLILERAPWL